jgi:hypothetical protein
LALTGNKMLNSFSTAKQNTSSLLIAET